MMHPPLITAKEEQGQLSLQQAQGLLHKASGTLFCA
jgi:hypothetical protein